MATANPRRNSRAAPQAARATKPEGNKALKVVPKVDGFRRAGRAFDGETTIPLTELSDADYAQLINESMLVTALIDLADAPADAPAA